VRMVYSCVHVQRLYADHMFSI
jgi:hypothetical protein